MGQEISMTMRGCLHRRGFINENLSVEGSRCFDLKKATDREELLVPDALTDDFVTSMAKMEFAQMEVCEEDDCNSTPENEVCGEK